MWQFSIFIGNRRKHKTTDIWRRASEDQCVPDKTGCSCWTVTRSVRLARQGCWCCACRSSSPVLHESYCRITSLCHDGRVPQEVRRLCECPEALGMFYMDFKNICEFWSLIKTHDLLVCNIIKTLPYNGCSQMVSISLKTKKSFIAHPWCLLSVVGLEKYSAHDWRAATSVQRAPVTWREWGLWSRELNPGYQTYQHNIKCRQAEAWWKTWIWRSNRKVVIKQCS